MKQEATISPASETPPTDALVPSISDEAPKDPLPPLLKPETTNNDDPKDTDDDKQKLKLGSKRGVETMFRTAYRTQLDLTALADNKANIMISINGLIISIIIASISSKIDSNTWLLIPTSALLLSCLLAIIFAILAARPRVASNDISLNEVRRREANILFFGNFTSLTQNEFMAGMVELMKDKSEVYIQMIRDIYGIGSVLEKKFQMLRVSYTVFMYGLFISITLYITVYVLVVLNHPGGATP